MENVIIMGYGVVGKAMSIAYGIKNKWDINQDNNTNLREFYKKNTRDRFYVISVPTPTENGKQDVSAVTDVITRVKNIGIDNNTIFVLRSTVLPGTTSWLEKQYGINIVHFPEFLTEKTAVLDEMCPEFKILGYNNIVVGNKVMRKFHCDNPEWYKPETTELVKYTMNTFFATKVTLGNVFSDLAKHFGADYGVIQECLEAHKWGSINGWNPYHGNKRGFHGKCLPKDVGAISFFDKTGFLSKLLEVNDALSKV